MTIFHFLHFDQSKVSQFVVKTKSGLEICQHACVLNWPIDRFLWHCKDIIKKCASPLIRVHTSVSCSLKSNCFHSVLLCSRWTECMMSSSRLRLTELTLFDFTVSRLYPASSSLGFVICHHNYILIACTTLFNADRLKFKQRRITHKCPHMGQDVSRLPDSLKSSCLCSGSQPKHSIQFFSLDPFSFFFFSVTLFQNAHMGFCVISAFIAVTF